MDFPVIPEVDKKTSYQQLKKIVEMLRKLAVASHLTDSATVTIVDNVGGGRSAEVIVGIGPVGPTGPTGPTGP